MVLTGPRREPDTERQDPRRRELGRRHQHVHAHGLLGLLEPLRRGADGGDLRVSIGFGHRELHEPRGDAISRLLVIVGAAEADGRRSAEDEVVERHPRSCRNSR